MGFCLLDWPFISFRGPPCRRFRCMAADRHVAIVLEKKTKGTERVLDRLNVNNVDAKRTIDHRCFMYAIFTYMWLTYMINAGIYSIHGAYGCCKFFGGLRPIGFLPKHSNMTLVSSTNVKKYRHQIQKSFIF